MMDISADQVWAVLTAAVTIATFITALTPSTSDNEWVAKAKKVLNALAGNVLHNKNADDK